MLGIVQEQHSDRARLFMQWKQMQWPVLVDSLNLLRVAVVPITLAIDEHGIVRAVNPPKETIEEEFVNRTFEPPASTAVPETRASRPSARTPDQSASPETWRKYGEALFLWDGQEAIPPAIDALERGARDAHTDFRLGVLYRARYDSPFRRPGDFRRAVEHWQRALNADPNQYIWRRRIQQYGPRLDKPYPFYDWVPEARAAVRARGESPVKLAVEPAGAEYAQPVNVFETATEPVREPDPKRRIQRDLGEFIQIETVAVPSAIRASDATRVHVVMRPNVARKAHWNNEAEDLVVWLRPPAGWQVDAHLQSVRRPKEVVSKETRRVEFELRSPSDAPAGPITVPAYALYYVCEDVDGTCLYRRQDVEVEVRVRR